MNHLSWREAQRRGHPSEIFLDCRARRAGLAMTNREFISRLPGLFVKALILRWRGV